MLVVFLSVSNCFLTQSVVRSTGCSVVFTGLSIGSNTFRYVRSSSSNSIEKKGKLRITQRMPSIVLLRCRNRRPINGLVRFVKNGASGMVLDKEPVSMSASIFSSLTSSGKNSLFRIFLMASLVIVGETL